MKFIFALLISVALFIPVLVQISGVRLIDDEQFRKQEKRDRVQFEIERPFDWRSLKALPNSIDTWFKDNFGLRSDLISLCARLEYDLFGKSMEIHKVVAGKNGYLFLGDAFENVLKQSMNIEYFNEVKLTAFMDSLENIQSYLNREGVAFLFVIAPNKHSIYPEYLPSRFRKSMSGHNVYDQVVARLSHSDIHFVDLKRVLTESKRQYGDLLYYKTDSHWSDLGAYIGYRAIMDAVSVIPGRDDGISFSDIIIPEMVDYSIDLNQNGYDLSQMANLRRVDDFYSDIAFSQPLENLKFHDLRTDLGLPQNSNHDNNLETFEYVKVTNWRADNGYHLLLFRDSFCNAIAKFFNRAFQEVTYISNAEIDKTDFSIVEMVKKSEPDIVIFEIAERLLLYRFLQPLSIEDLLHYQDLKLLLDEKRASLLDISGSGINTMICGKSKDIQSIDVKESVLVINSSGEDPFIEIEKVDSVAGRESVAIKIDMDVTEGGIMQLFYQTEDEPFFSESKSISFPINKGRNTIYKKLYDSGLNGLFRIDPGKNKGQYCIRALVIK